MSDTAPPPAGQIDEAEIQPRKRRRSPEHAFQAWVDRLIDRIVLPPMFVTGIDHASQMTDNARARMAGRGIRFGLPDVFVCQSACDTDEIFMTPPTSSLWIELKRGSKLSGAQEAVHKAMRAAGQNVCVCDSMAGVVAGLRNYGFDIHANADELAREYEMRVKANEKAPATPYKPGGKARVRTSPSRTRKWAQMQRGMG